MVQMWGRCHPTECDWGETAAFQDPKDNSTWVTWTTGFSVTSQKLTLLPDGNLELAGHTHYTDSRGRVDRDSKEIFVKELVHDWSDNATGRPPVPAPPVPVPPTVPAQVPPPPKRVPPLPKGEPPVIGAIKDKWMALGGRNGSLRQPLNAEAPTSDHVGRWQQFQGGVILWHPDLGAFAITRFVQLWGQSGREKFGYPATEMLRTANKRGYYQHFRAMHLPNRPWSSIYLSEGNGAHTVFGQIRDRWEKLGWEGGKLGFPTSDAHAEGQSTRQDFEGGIILWSPKTGAREHYSATY